MSGEEAPVAQQQQDQTPDEPPSGSESGMQRSHPGQQEAAAALTSRALVLTGHGGYDKIRLQVRTARADPGSGEVLVRVRACGLNFADLMGRQGLYEPLPGPPVIMGMEGSGVVQAVGEGVADRKVGDRVLMLSPSGLWQELAVVAADHTFLMPDAMSFEEAAALPVNYLTAHMMLFQMGNLRPGKSILIHMAAGGVGTAATQLCRTVPDVTVFGTASASKHESIVQGGVTHPIDYRTKDYVEEIRKISPKGVDIVLDPLGGSDTQKGFGLLKPLGSIIVFGAANCVTGQKKNLLALAKTWYNQLSISTLKLMQANRAVCGFHLGFLSDHQLIASTMSTLMELYTQGKIQPRIDSTFHFEQVGDAMRRMHDRLNVGKVILLPEPERKEDAAAEPKRNAAPEENTTEAAVAAEGKEEEQKKEEGEAGLEGGMEELKD